MTYNGVYSNIIVTIESLPNNFKSDIKWFEFCPGGITLRDKFKIDEFVPFFLPPILLSISKIYSSASFIIVVRKRIPSNVSFSGKTEPMIFLFWVMLQC
ncbi:hypothetical protein SAMN05444274_101646 [Mariniphaga anaerophila]|uniref:Uncharacterized protein n=1 Tax=Mariniphaga anaerophila TaxID=1484053 RepID=A0A1M4UD59_9BACT|nr:hypothetical protein SAMN05444274_101646 [Mariniphaga anaerophila]